MYCIAGLGNPGKKFEHTRHNAGFIIAQLFAGSAPFVTDDYIKDKVAEPASLPPVILPTTFMNDSGIGVKNFLKLKGIKPEHLLTIHDDLDLPFGKFKFSFDASAAGHNGVQSIIDQLGTKKFWRLRYGIAGEHRGTITGEAYVLKPFSKKEYEYISNDQQVIDAIKLFVEQGPEKTMNLYHTKNSP